MEAWHDDGEVDDGTKLEAVRMSRNLSGHCTAAETVTEEVTIGFGVPIAMHGFVVCTLATSELFASC